MSVQEYEWATDKSRFGLKLLQKMGWTEGKGLGRDEDGRVDIVKHARLPESKMTSRPSEMKGVGLQAVSNGWKAPAAFATGFNDVLSRLAPIGEPNEEERPKTFISKDSPQPDASIVGKLSVVNNSGKSSRVTKENRGFYERRRARKNVGMYSQDDLREIFGGVVPSSPPIAEKPEKGQSSKTVSEHSLSVPSTANCESKIESESATDEMKEFVKPTKSTRTHSCQKKKLKIIKKKHRRESKNGGNGFLDARKLAARFSEKDDELRKLIEELKEQ